MLLRPPIRSRLRMVLLTIAMLGVTLGTQSCTPAVKAKDIPQVSVPSASASAILQSIGINVHETYNDTTYAPNNDPRALVGYLDSLGVKWVRIGLKISPPPYEREFMSGLAAAGIHVLAVTGGPNDKSGGFSQGQSQLLIRTLKNSVYTGRINAIELPNELDASGLSTWPANLISYCKEYYTALKSDAATRQIPVVGPSMAQPANFQQIPSAIEFQDVRNIHPYAANGWPESPFLENWVNSSLGGAASSTQPVYATEFGYHNAVNLTNGVSEAASATYIPRTFLWNYFHGVSRSFLYELFDESPDPESVNTEDHYGLVAVTGTRGVPDSYRQRAKPAYRTVKALIATLRSKSTRPTAESVVRQKGRGVEIVKLRRADGGTFYLAWRVGRIDSTTEQVTFQTVAPSGATLRMTDLATKTSRSKQFEQARATISVGSAIRMIEVSPS